MIASTLLAQQRHHVGRRRRRDYLRVLLQIEAVALERERSDVEEGRGADDRGDLPPFEVLDLGESGILARDDGAEHRGRHARDPERHAVLERLGGEGEAHVDRVHVLRSELIEERPGRARHDRVLGLPAALAEQVLLVDDLRRRPAELEVGEADLALSLGPQPRGATQRGRRRRGRAGSEKLATSDRHSRLSTTP